MYIPLMNPCTAVYPRQMLYAPGQNARYEGISKTKYGIQLIRYKVVQQSIGRNANIDI